MTMIIDCLSSFWNVFKMKVLLYCAVILAIFFHFTICVYGQANFSSVCVIEQRTKLSRPCKFPFIFKERLFNNCTDYADKKGNYWCSTNVNSNQRHISKGKYWGYCDTTNTLCVENQVTFRYECISMLNIQMYPK